MGPDLPRKYGFPLGPPAQRQPTIPLDCPKRPGLLRPFACPPVPFAPRPLRATTSYRYDAARDKQRRIAYWRTGRASRYKWEARLARAERHRGLPAAAIDSVILRPCHPPHVHQERPRPARFPNRSRRHLEPHRPSESPAVPSARRRRGAGGRRPCAGRCGRSDAQRPGARGERSAHLAHRLPEVVHADRPREGARHAGAGARPA